MRHRHTTILHSDRTLINSSPLLNFFSTPSKYLSQDISLSRSFCIFLSAFNRSLCFLRTISSTWKFKAPLFLLVSSCFLASPSASMPNQFKFLLSGILKHGTNSTLGICELGHFSCKIILAPEKWQTCFSVTTKKVFQVVSVKTPPSKNRREFCFMPLLHVFCNKHVGKY